MQRFLTFAALATLVAGRAFGPENRQDARSVAPARDVDRSVVWDPAVKRDFGSILDELFGDDNDDDDEERPVGGDPDDCEESPIGGTPDECDELPTPEEGGNGPNPNPPPNPEPAPEPSPTPEPTPAPVTSETPEEEFPTKAPGPIFSTIVSSTLEIPGGGGGGPGNGTDPTRTPSRVPTMQTITVTADPVTVTFIPTDPCVA